MTIMAASSREGKTLRDLPLERQLEKQQRSMEKIKLSMRLLAVTPVKMKNWLVCLLSNSYIALCR